MAHRMDIIQTAKVDNVRLKTKFSKKVARGTLYLTTTQLIFVDPVCAKETWILHAHILSIEKLPLTAAGSPLRIRCKTFQNVTLVVPKEKECHDIYSALLYFSNPENLEDLYAFSYSPQTEKLTQSAGWALFDIKSDYTRMGVPPDLWTTTQLNRTYELCDTYPSILYVPKSASNEVLIGSSKFRSRARLPVLSFYHKSTKAAVSRCSQPLGGFKGRCVEDEQMIQALLNSNPNSSFIYIVDTRPRLNAMANKAAGKGYESEDFYENVKFKFVGIENIHVMRQSLFKMLDVISENPKTPAGTFHSGLEASSWLKHVKSIMDTSVFIAKAVAEERASVLVHCSDGWDRTAQTCSLASIILDPYYRTIHGFQVLIEKEWLSFGHKFTDRCGLLQSDQKEFSPVFLQFLESIWQLLQQFPFAFQFNERFLLTLHDHVYSCQFGTFLGNCQRERWELNLPKRTYSLWGYMWQNISDYANPLYREMEHDEVLWPDTSPQAIKFWRAMYNRYDNEVHPRETLLDSLSSIIDHNDSLQDHIKLLIKRIELLKLLQDDTVDVPIPNGTTTNDNSNTESTPEITQDNDQENENQYLSISREYSINNSNEETSQNSEAGISTLDIEELRLENSTEKSTETPGSSETSTNVVNNAGIQDVVSSMVIPEHLSKALRRKGMTLEDLLTELPDIAIKWKSVRDVSQCSSCVLPIAFLSRKYHCWNCGEVFCRRCIERQCSLPAHYSENRVPVCKQCYKLLQRTK